MSIGRDPRTHIPNVVYMKLDGEDIEVPIEKVRVFFPSHAQRRGPVQAIGVYRTQFPLMAAYGVTIHRSQVQFY